MVARYRAMTTALARRGYYRGVHPGLCVMGGAAYGGLANDTAKELPTNPAPPVIKILNILLAFLPKGGYNGKVNSILGGNNE